MVMPHLVSHHAHRTSCTPVRDLVIWQGHDRSAVVAVAVVVVVEVPQTVGGRSMIDVGNYHGLGHHLRRLLTQHAL